MIRIVEPFKLEAIAAVDEMSVNEEIRRAIGAHIEARRQDADFQKRLQLPTGTGAGPPPHLSEAWYCCAEPSDEQRVGV